MTLTLEEKLAKADLLAVPYARGPAGARPFVISIQEAGGGPGIFRTWQGAAEIEVTPSKKHKQAVLTATELPRSVTRTVEILDWQTGKAIDKISPSMRDTAIGSFPTFMGEDVKFTVADEISKATKGVDYNGNFTHWRLSIAVTGTAPANEQTLLVGMDETHYFVSALPEKALTVVEAHELLKPVSAKAEGTKRQGEWFFIPVKTKKLQDALFARLSELNWGSLEQDSSHHGNTLIHGNATYAIGDVTDGRKGRHKPLVLTEWHRVQRNREVEVASQPRQRYWD